MLVELTEREVRALAGAANIMSDVWREVFDKDEVLQQACSELAFRASPLETGAMRLETALMAEGLSE